VVLLGAALLYLPPPPTEREQPFDKDLKNRGARFALESSAVDEERKRIKQETGKEKSAPEKKPAIEQKRPAPNAFEGTDSEEPSKESWSIQVAVFRAESDAERLADRLEEEGYDAHISSGEKWHRVLIGEFASLKEAGWVRDTVAEEQGFKDAFVTKG
jgi:cell division septation protein DedD